MWRDRFLEAGRGLFARPLIPAALALLLGVSASVDGAAPPSTVIFAALVAIGLIGWAAKRRYRNLFAFLLLIILAAYLGFIRGSHAENPPAERGHVLGYADRASLRVEGTVDQAPEFGAKTTQVSLYARACTIKSDRRACHGRVILYISEPVIRWRAGDVVVATLKLKSFQRGGNPGDFDYARYMQRRGYWVRGFLRKASGLAIIGVQNPLSWRTRIERTRGRLAEWMDASLPTDAAQLSKALSIGMRKGISQDVREVFLASGTAHLLAISGLHLGVMAFWIYWLARYFWRRFAVGLRYLTPDRAASMFTLPLVWVVAFLAGLQVSTLRAAVMISIYLLARFLWKRSDSLTGLALAVIVVLCLWPYALLEIGFKLSFLCVLAILLGVPRIVTLLPYGLRTRMDQHDRIGRLLRQLSFLLATSLVTFLITAPVIADGFHVLSWSGLAINLVIVPIYSLSIIPLFGIALLLAPISQLAAMPFLQVAAWLTQGSVAVLGWVFETIGGCVYWPSPPAWLAFVYYLLLAAFVLRIPPALGWRGEPHSELLDPPASQLRFVAGLLALFGMMSVVASTSLGEKWVPSEHVWVLNTRSGAALLVSDNNKGLHLLSTGEIDSADDPPERQIVPRAVWSIGKRYLKSVWQKDEKVNSVSISVVSGEDTELINMTSRAGCRVDRNLLRCDKDTPQNVTLWQVPAYRSKHPEPVWVMTGKTRMLMFVANPRRIADDGWLRLAWALERERLGSRLVVVTAGADHPRGFARMQYALKPEQTILAMSRDYRRRLSKKRWETIKRTGDVLRTDISSAIEIDIDGFVKTGDKE
jgi:ComEC/Rec2-related protein